ncbi:MAG: hypothetical protein JNL38_11300, partial [Myxococcales bacterium]|nr:hypothetical protein [Myxococcales bacterium]
MASIVYGGSQFLLFTVAVGFGGGAPTTGGGFALAFADGAAVVADGAALGAGGTSAEAIADEGVAS